MLFKFSLVPAAMMMATFAGVGSLIEIIAGVLASAGAVITLLYGVKYKVVADQQGLTINNLQADRDTWKDMAEARARELETAHTEKQEILKAVSTLKEEKARLESLPNLSIIIEQMSKEAQRAEAASQRRVELIVGGFTDVMNTHEAAAAERHSELIAVLGRNRS